MTDDKRPLPVNMENGYQVNRKCEFDKKQRADVRTAVTNQLQVDSSLFKVK